MAIRQNSAGNYYVEFTYKRKVYRKSTRGKNKTAAIALEAKMRAELFGQQELGIKRERLITEAVDDYLKQNEGTSKYRNIVIIGNWLNSHTKKMNVSEITEPFLHKLVDIKRDEGASDGTIKNYLVFINQVVKLARSKGYNTTQYSLPKTKQVKSRLRYLTIEEEVKLLEALDPNSPNNKVHKIYARPNLRQADSLVDDYDLVVCLLDTGCRLNEITNLKWKDVDLNNKVIHIWRSKTANEILLPMTNRVFDVISRRSSFAESDYVFTDSTGEGPKRSTVGIKTALKMLGMDDVTNHTLRHTAAARLIQNGMSLYEVSVILGHSNIMMTQRYAHLSHADVTNKAVNVLNGLHRSEKVERSESQPTTSVQI